MRPNVGGSMMARAVKPLEAIEFRIMPADFFYSNSGISTGYGIAIDDDGISTGYERGEVTQTRCDYSFSNGTFIINVFQTGDFKGKPKNVTLHFSFTQLPPMVLDGGAGHAFEARYDHSLLGSVFTLQNVVLTAEPISFTVSFQPAYQAQNLQNFIGVLGRVRRARYVKDALDVINTPYGDGRSNLTAYVLTALHMSPSFLNDLPKLWEDAQSQVAQLLQSNGDLKKDPRRSKFVSTMMGLNAATVDSQPPQAKGTKQPVSEPLVI